MPHVPEAQQQNAKAPIVTWMPGPDFQVLCTLSYSSSLWLRLANLCSLQPPIFRKSYVVHKAQSLHCLIKRLYLNNWKLLQRICLFGSFHPAVSELYIKAVNLHGDILSIFWSIKWLTVFYVQKFQVDSPSSSRAGKDFRLILKSYCHVEDIASEQTDQSADLQDNPVYLCNCSLIALLSSSLDFFSWGFSLLVKLALLKATWQAVLQQREGAASLKGDVWRPPPHPSQNAVWMKGSLDFMTG